MTDIKKSFFIALLLFGIMVAIPAIGAPPTNSDLRVAELERKVSGMQKAINRLFARVEKLEGKKQ